MKNIFSSDVSEKYNSTLPGAEFYLTVKTSERQARKLAAAKREVRDAAVKFPASTILKVLTVAAVIVLGGLVGSAVMTLGDYKNNLGSLISDNLWLPFAAAAAVLGLIVFPILRKRLIVLRKTGEVYKKAEEKLSLMRQSLREAQGVPENAKPVDVLAKRFIVKNGKEKFTAATTDFRCFEKRIFASDNSICFADESSVLSIPKADFVHMRKCAKPVSVLGWNKTVPPEGFDSSIVSAKNHSFKLSEFVVIELKHDGEDYELVFPPYELSSIRKVYDSIPGESNVT